MWTPSGTWYLRIPYLKLLRTQFAAEVSVLLSRGEVSVGLGWRQGGWRQAPGEPEAGPLTESLTSSLSSPTQSFTPYTGFPLDAGCWLGGVVQPCHSNGGDVHLSFVSFQSSASLQLVLLRKK